MAANKRDQAVAIIKAAMADGVTESEKIIDRIAKEMYPEHKSPATIARACYRLSLIERPKETEGAPALNRKASTKSDTPPPATAEEAKAEATEGLESLKEELMAKGETGSDEEKVDTEDMAQLLGEAVDAVTTPADEARA